MKGWHRLTAVLLLTLAGVEGLDFAVKCAPLPQQASRFVHYYEAIGRTDSIGSWQKFLLSWAFAERA